MKINDLYSAITDYRNGLIINQEKSFYELIKTEYAELLKTVSIAIIPLLLKLSNKEGKIERNDLQGTNTLPTIEEKLSEAFKDVYEVEKKEAKEGLQKLVKDEYAYSLFFLAQTQGLTGKVQGLTQGEINKVLKEDWCGEHYATSLKNKKMDTITAIKKDLVRESTQGGLTPKTAQEIFEKRIESAQNHSLLVYQNELSRKKTAVAEIMEEMTRDYKDDDDEEEIFQWVCTLDDRTCKICGQLDHKRMESSKWKVKPPVHPRCRCRFVTIIEGWEQGLRSERDLKTYKSQLTSDKSFAEWRKKHKL